MTTSNLIVALVDAHPKAILLLYSARKLAREKGYRWRIVHVERTDTVRGSDEGAEERLRRLFTLAEQMGAEVQQIQAETLERGLQQLIDVEKAVLDTIVIGITKKKGRFASLWERSQRVRATRLARHYAGVEVVPLGGATYKRQFRWPVRRQQWVHFIYAFMAVGVAYLVAAALEEVLPPALFRINIQNISVLFMTACAFTAGRYGLLPGLVAAVLSAMIYNYYYVPPIRSLELLTVTKGLSMALFFLAAVLISIFTGRARLHGERSAQRQRSTEVLFMLYRIASNAFSRQQALEVLQQKLAEMLHIEVAFFLPRLMQADTIEAAVPADLVLDERDRRALETCWSEIKTTGLASPSHTLASWRFKPMVTPSGIIGIFAVRPRAGSILEPWQAGLLAGIADQTAIIIEHLELTRSMESARLNEEREKLRTMLLSSVSHDLKTPLAGIMGALRVHRSVGERLTPEARADLLNDALEEAQRLDSFITNILDMTRLESGEINFRPDWHDMQGVVQQVVKRMQHRLHTRRLTVVPCEQAIEVLMDDTMTEQILQNLLDNACKYTAPDVEITITIIICEKRGVCCAVRDTGTGIPEDKLASVFDKYARLQKKDSQVAGTGLGLAISKAVMEAQGGSICAENHPDGGAVFTFCFPQWRPVEAHEPHKE
ncbi:MAG: ATP-binding protein [Pseudomonadota bacterium]